MRASLALSALRQGRLAEAEALLDEIGEVPSTDMTASLVTAQVHAELRLARGDVEGGLAAFDRSLALVRGREYVPSGSGLEPWTLIALATDLAAHALFAQTPERLAHAEALLEETETLLASLPAIPDGSIDFPVTGMSLAALAAGLLTREDPGAQAERAVRLLALAHGFGYNRWFPVMAWEPLAELAEAAAPGRLAAVLQEYGDARGRELRPEAERVLALLPVTSSG
jgi:hypothetical protein